MKNLFDTEGHLNAETIGAFYRCALDADALDAVAAHLAECPLCAEQAAAHATVLHAAPAGLAEQVAARIAEPHVTQRAAQSVKQHAAPGFNPGAKQPRRQAHALFFYSMRVAAAAGIAIVILCSGLLRYTPQPEEPQSSTLPQKLNQTLFYVSNTLSEFSNKMIQTEGIQNEKTEK